MSADASSPRAAVAVALLAFAFGFSQVPLKTVGWNFDSLPGDFGDNRFNNVMLEHGYRWIRGDAVAFWHPPFMYPARWVMGCSDAHIGTLPIYAAMRGTGADPEHAFQITFLLLGSFNFWSAWWAARRLGLGAAGSAAAAYLFAFALPVVSFQNHFQLTPRFFVPLAVVWWWEFLTADGTSKRSWRMALTAAAVVCQLYFTIYIGYFTVGLLAAMSLAAAAILRGSLPTRELLRPGWRVTGLRVGVVAAAGLLLLPLVLPHLRASQGVALQGLGYRMLITPDALSWVRPSVFSREWQPLVGLTDDGDDFAPEKAMFPGLAGVFALSFGLACVGGARSSTDSRTRFAAVGAVAVMLLLLLTAKFWGVTAYRLTFDIPGASAMRAVSRVILVLLFPLGIALGIGIDRLSQRCECWRRQTLLAGSLLLLVAIDQSTLPIDHGVWNGMRYSIAEAQARREATAEKVRAHPGVTGFYSYVRVGEGVSPIDAVSISVDAMWAATMTGIPTVNGYAYEPPGWAFFQKRADVVEWLEKNRVNQEFLSGFVMLGMPE